MYKSEKKQTKQIGVDSITEINKKASKKQLSLDAAHGSRHLTWLNCY